MIPTLCKIKSIRKGNYMNKIKKGLALFICSIILVGSLGTGAMANNYLDATFSIYTDGSGGDWGVPSRQKTDATSAYIRNTCSYTYTASLWATTATTENQQYYGYIKDCSVTSYRRIVAGYAYYFPNYVYEWGYQFCAFQLSPETHDACTITGKWSPDSI